MFAGKKCFFARKKLFIQVARYFRLVNLKDIFPFMGCHVGRLLTICCIMFWRSGECLP